MLKVKYIILIGVFFLLGTMVSTASVLAACGCSDCFLHGAWGTCVCYDGGYQDCNDDCCKDECEPDFWSQGCNSNEDCGSDHECAGGACIPKGCPTGGCFVSGTKIEREGNKKAIKNLERGEEVVSLEPETNQEKTSLVKDVYEVTRSAYYKVKLQDGQEVEVTGEHPLYAIQREKIPLSFWEYLRTESLIRQVVNFLLD